MTRTRRRPTAPKPVRELARATQLSVRRLAEAVVDGQPLPERAEHMALLRWLTLSVANANPGIDDDELAEQVTARIEELAESGDATAKAAMKAPFHEYCMNLVRAAIALEGAPWVPEPPTIPKQQRMDSIAATMLELTGWPSVDDETVVAIYRWLFGDEALFLDGTEMRVGAAQRMAENPALREVHVPHPATGELVLVTRDDILEHAESDQRVLDADVCYAERQARGMAG